MLVGFCQADEICIAKRNTHFYHKSGVRLSCQQREKTLSKFSPLFLISAVSSTFSFFANSLKLYNDGVQYLLFIMEAYCIYRRLGALEGKNFICLWRDKNNSWVLKFKGIESSLLILISRGQRSRSCDIRNCISTKWSVFVYGKLELHA